MLMNFNPMPAEWGAINPLYRYYSLEYGKYTDISGFSRCYGIEPCALWGGGLKVLTYGWPKFETASEAKLSQKFMT